MAVNGVSGVIENSAEARPEGCSFSASMYRHFGSLRSSQSSTFFLYF